MTHFYKDVPSRKNSLVREIFFHSKSANYSLMRRLPTLYPNLRKCLCTQGMSRGGCSCNTHPYTQPDIPPNTHP